MVVPERPGLFDREFERRSAHASYRALSDRDRGWQRRLHPRVCDPAVTDALNENQLRCTEVATTLPSACVRPFTVTLSPLFSAAHAAPVKAVEPFVTIE